MGLAPVAKKESRPGAVQILQGTDSLDWLTVAASSTLIAGGLLLLAGQRRAALVAAASGTALALMDQQETLRAWWGQLPGYMDEVQQVIGKVQSTVDDLADKREQLRSALTKTPSEA
ncbi:MAG TPA: hypothetical protein VMV57_13000 [Terracidiphilus sp.]|nr:hypothetical protein [Terracidiphilus sp.]